MSKRKCLLDHQQIAAHKKFLIVVYSSIAFHFSNIGNTLKLSLNFQSFGFFFSNSLPEVFILHKLFSFKWGLKDILLLAKMMNFQKNPVLCIHVYVHIDICIRMLVYVYAHTCTHVYTHIYTHIKIYMYIYILCICIFKLNFITELDLTTCSLPVFTDYEK